MMFLTVAVFVRRSKKVPRQSLNFFSAAIANDYDHELPLGASDRVVSLYPSANNAVLLLELHRHNLEPQTGFEPISSSLRGKHFSLSYWGILWALLTTPRTEHKCLARIDVEVTRSNSGELNEAIDLVDIWLPVLATLVFVQSTHTYP